MSTKSNAFIVALLFARVASAEPSMPTQLRTLTSSNLVQLDSAVAVVRDYRGNVALAEANALTASYQLTTHWAPMIRLGFIADNAQGAALDGTSLGNPIAGATYTRTEDDRRLALFAGMAIPVGTGGGNDPDRPSAKANQVASTVRPADEAMFAVNYATAIVGADVAYVNRGFTAQAEATLSQSVRVRGDKTTDGTDAARTRAAIGVHLGIFLGRHVSLGSDLHYQRWLSQPTMIDEMTDARVSIADDDLATLTASIGVRGHFRIGKASIHPGLAYTRGFDGFALHGPMNISKQANTVSVSIPVLF